MKDGLNVYIIAYTVTKNTNEWQERWKESYQEKNDEMWFTTGRDCWKTCKKVKCGQSRSLGIPLPQVRGSELGQRCVILYAGNCYLIPENSFFAKS
jgi:hypothetical protein